MSLERFTEVPWRRRHDHPYSDWKAREVVYPQSLEEMLVLCSTREPDRRFKAAGSHWALSEAAYSDYTFIETNDPTGKQPAMNRTLQNLHQILNRSLWEDMKSAAFPYERGTVIHVEAGKRIHDLYAGLDEVDPLDDEATIGGFLALHYGLRHCTGPWGLKTAGNAGGQTIVGAFSTGTHGGDFDRGPVADSVVAMHLVTDGGRHYWVERQDDERFPPQLTDDDALKYRYGRIDLAETYPAIDPERRFPKFEILRDDAVFDAVLVSAGRFGIIYSVVLAAVQQYSLWERRRLMKWQNVKPLIANRNSILYSDTAERPDTPPVPGAGPQQFLMMVVCFTEHCGPQNLCGVTKRWPIPLDLAPDGREQRVGAWVNDPDTPKIWEKAGKSAPYSAESAAIPIAGNWILPADPLAAGNPSALDLACGQASFLRGLLEQVRRELEEFMTSAGGVIGSTILAVAVPGAAGLLGLLPAFDVALRILDELLDALGLDDRLGEWLAKIMRALLNPFLPEPGRAAAHFAWQMVAYLAFSSMQSNTDFGARSYAVNDRKNYLDQVCESGNVDSIEVFFDSVGDSNRVISYVDALIGFNRRLELQGRSTLGYASLRFTGKTRALLGMQRWDTTCSIEVAAVKDMPGSAELVNYASKLAIHPAYRGILHWGQRNDCTADDIELRFGAAGTHAPGALAAWRHALAQLTNHGELDGFSSRYTRALGLEVV